MKVPPTASPAAPEEKREGAASLPVGAVVAVVAADGMAGGKGFGPPFGRETPCRKGPGERAAAVGRAVACLALCAVAFRDILMCADPVLPDAEAVVYGNKERNC